MRELRVKLYGWADTEKFSPQHIITRLPWHGDCHTTLGAHRAASVETIRGNPQRRPHLPQYSGGWGWSTGWDEGRARLPRPRVTGSGLVLHTWTCCPCCDYVLVSEMIVGDGSSTFLEMQKARFFATLSVYSASNKRVAESCASLDWNSPNLSFFFTSKALRKQMWGLKLYLNHIPLFL